MGPHVAGFFQNVASHCYCSHPQQTTGLLDSIVGTVAALSLLEILRMPCHHFLGRGQTRASKMLFAWPVTWQWPCKDVWKLADATVFVWVLWIVTWCWRGIVCRCNAVSLLPGCSCAGLWGRFWILEVRVWILVRVPAWVWGWFRAGSGMVYGGSGDFGTGSGMAGGFWRFRCGFQSRWFWDFGAGFWGV